ncbi:MAG: hypothetical protein ABFS86_00745 [Planctomycetota bacterium]
MRIVATLVVVAVGALLLVTCSLSERPHGKLDDFGSVILFGGLIALAVELYVLPFLKRRDAED